MLAPLLALLAAANLQELATPELLTAPQVAALQATATVVQDCLVADLIAVAGSLDPVMGDADR